MGGLVRILKSTPPAHIKNQDSRIRVLAGHHISQQLLQTVSSLQAQATFTGIGIGLNDSETACLGILRNRGSLILQRLTLVFG
jgi:hypothetical protein